jgi:cell division protein FtsN
MQRQRGGTFLGFVLGLVIGLGIAFGIALYVTKVPLPFLSKGQTRSADQNDAEAKKNKDWDPNALITGKPAPKAAAPSDAASGGVPPPLPPAPAAPTTTATPTPPAAIADPIGALANAKAASSAMPTGQISYYVQVGAFRASDDAQSQRAKLSLTGVEAAVTEREQGGRPIYRVRVGPFEKVEDAERTKDKLDKAGTDTVLVKVQR